MGVNGLVMSVRGQSWGYIVARQSDWCRIAFIAKSILSLLG